MIKFYWNFSIDLDSSVIEESMISLIIRVEEVPNIKQIMLVFSEVDKAISTFAKLYPL